VSVQGRQSVEEEPVVVRFSGELDAGDPDFAAELLTPISGGSSRVIVDLLNVSFIDSSVIRALLLAQREVEGGEGWLRVVYTHHLVRRVIDMCGLAEVFPQYPSIEAARRDVSAGPPSSEKGHGKGQPS
jgi:anti-anti-sigma factor